MFLVILLASAGHSQLSGFQAGAPSFGNRPNIWYWKNHGWVLDLWILGTLKLGPFQKNAGSGRARLVDRVGAKPNLMAIAARAKAQMLVGKIPVAQIGFFRHGLCEAIAWIFLTFWWENFSEDLMSRTWGRTREVFQGKILSRTCIGVLKHPAGPETVLVKIEFYKKKMVLPQRGNHCCHLKSGKFGRPNLGVFWANGCKWCFRYSKTWFSCLFRLDKCRHLFHYIFRSICAVFSSSFLYLLMNRRCHILAYNMTSLCLAPKELGMNCLQLVHAA